MRKKSIGSTNDHSKTSRQNVYQRGSQREGSPHYVFLYSDDEDDNEQEDIPLEMRNRSKTPARKVEVIKVQLKPEDTLQALALRYRCTISELKRINNIHKENEIFAHRSIKVPVQPFSIFTENLIDYESGPSTSRETTGGRETADLSRDEQLINLIATPIATMTTVYQNNGINDIILNSICEPVAKTNDRETTFVSDNETEQLLDEASSNNSQNSTIDTFKCSGADWGLSWAHLLGVSLLLGFAGPLIYIYYIAEETSDKKSALITTQEP